MAIEQIQSVIQQTPVEAAIGVPCTFDAFIEKQVDQRRLRAPGELAVVTTTAGKAHDICSSHLQEGRCADVCQALKTDTGKKLWWELVRTS
jgi:hypothetical protein